MAHPCFGTEAWKLATNWLLFQGYAFCGFCQNPPKFGKAVRLLTNLVHAYSAARRWIFRLSAQRAQSLSNLPQGRSTVWRKVKMCFQRAAPFFRAIRGWQTLVLGSLHLCVSLFFPKQSWGASSLDVDEKNGRTSKVRTEAWGLVGKVKSWEGGREGVETWWALERAWQVTRALDSGQKDGE